MIPRLLIGACDEAEAAYALGIPEVEVTRIKSAIGGDDARMAPVSVDLDRRRVGFLDLAGATYVEPFFADTVERVRREHPSALDFDIDFDDLARAAVRHQRVPGGMVFHVGRCGSTLLANMLMASGRYLVLKEPDLVSDLLAAWLKAGKVSTARIQLERVIEAAIRCLLGSAPLGEGLSVVKHRVLKLSAWNVIAGDLLFRLFSGVRGVFIYRSPQDTVASLLHSKPVWTSLSECERATQTRFFPSLAAVPDELTISPVVLFAHAWRSAVDAALALDSERMLLLSYEMLIGETERALQLIASHLGHPMLSLDNADMEATRRIYSKDEAQSIRFDPTGTHSRPSLSREDAQEVWTITSESWWNAEHRSAVSKVPSRCQ